MADIFTIAIDTLSGNGLVFAFFIVGVITVLSHILEKPLKRYRIHASAIGIFLGLALACFGGYITGGSKGIADIGISAGVGVLGGTSLRDFVIISTAHGAEISEIKKCGPIGIAALFAGIVLSYTTGAIVAYSFGYHDVTSVTTIAAGAVTFVVGPVTGAAIGADSSVIAISVVAGLVKSVAVMLFTPVVAKRIGLSTPRTAMVYGGLVGSVSGTTAGLTATNPSLVPYGAMTASFYTGLGCILCPSILFAITKLFFT